MGCRLGTLCSDGGIWGLDKALAVGDAAGSPGMMAIPAAECGCIQLGKQYWDWKRELPVAPCINLH